MNKTSYSYPSAAPSNDEEEEKQQPFSLFKKKPYQHYEQQLTAQQIHFYISEGIGEPELYTDMIHRINVASPNDIIFIHLNTPGGQLDTGVQIINAMQNTPAKVVTVLESVAYSLGTLIFLAGDEMIVNDHCMMMFHNFKGGILGKGNELISQLDATVKWFNSFAKKMYVPFLTEEEFEGMLRGEDLWMQSPEIRRRLTDMVKAQSDPTPKRAKTPKAKPAEPKKPTVSKKPRATKRPKLDA